MGSVHLPPHSIIICSLAPGMQSLFSRPEDCAPCAAHQLVLSAFFAGYLCTQILGGWAAARYGGKPVLTVAVLLWSIFTLATPAAAAHSIGMLLFARFALGIGEGLALPTLQHLCAQWAPAPERSRFVAAVTSGQNIGTVLALLSAPLVAVNWPLIFYIFAAAGAAWLALWLRLAASTPDRSGCLCTRRSCEGLRLRQG